MLTNLWRAFVKLCTQALDFKIVEGIQEMRRIKKLLIFVRRILDEDGFNGRDAFNQFGFSCRFFSSRHGAVKVICELVYQ